MDEWLRSVGLGELVAVFRSQNITLDQAPELTEDDLRELGLRMGDRKRFLRAAAALGGGTAAPLPDEAPVIQTTRAERRPLTMMFVDLVNSSALAECLEPEDLLEVIRCYREFAGVAINRVGGHIARLVGDGILAYFCYPAANENDPERAVRAALEISRGIGKLRTPTDTVLNVRIGVATGRVIVSDLFAGGQPDLRSIIGSTPNLAARLQGFAPAGGIVIAEETYARVGSAFVCEEIGTREIRGFAQPHNAWRVIAEVAAFGRRGKAAQVPRLTPFYGRHAELGILGERWKRAQAGESGTVLIVGEPGIGKSRLVEHFLAATIEPSALVLRFAASALDEDSALHPVIDFLRATARLDPNRPHARDLGKLGAVLAGDAATRRAALPILAELVGLAGDDPAIALLTPAQLRERILSVLVDQVLLLAAGKPLCLAVEDAHWLDPTSTELLERLAGGIADRSIMVLVTAREGFTAPWIASRTTSVLRLLPLSAGNVSDMVRSLFINREIPEALGRAIARRTDGVPLFVEEVARALAAGHALDTANADEPGQSIPPSLHASLVARLDKSGDARTIAQIAAVIGRSARRDILAAVADVPESALEQPLATLRDARILLEVFSVGAQAYVFSHALLRDAAYDSLLREDRRILHLRVAEALRAHDAQTVAQQPELLAMHLTEGNQPEEAAPHWLEAARRSLARSALTEASRLLRRGLDALEKLPPSQSALHQRLELSALLGPVLIALKGPASPDAQDLYGSAYALGENLPEHPAQFPLSWGWWRVSRELGVKKHRASTLLARAVARDDPELLLQAHHCNWATHFAAGDFGRCNAHIDMGLGVYRTGDFRHHARLYGNHDALVCGLGALAQVEWMQGRPLSGLAREQEVKRWAGNLEHIGTHVHSLDVRILHRAERRDLAEVFRLAGELVDFTSEHGLADHRAKGLIFRGWTVAMGDDPAGGLGTLEEGLAREREIGTLEDFPLYICMYAEALARAGRPDRAIDVLQRERLLFEQYGLLFWMPEVLRILAQVTLQADAARIETAQTLLTDAEEMAKSQGVAMLVLRIAMTSARLGVGAGGPEHGVRRVAEALSRIAEDDGSAELAAARRIVAGVGDRLRLRSGGR